MQVVAVSTPADPEWRWRIVNYAGEAIEHSSATFRTVASALAAGTARLEELNVLDRSVPPGMYYRSTSHLRGR